MLTAVVTPAEDAGCVWIFSDSQEASMKLFHRAGSCDNGPCPNVFDTDAPGEPLCGVQGERLTDPQALGQLSKMPANDAVVLVPRAVILEYARRYRDEL
jgi:hypothetical protein